MVCVNCCGLLDIPEMEEISRETQTQSNFMFMECEYICKNCGRREKSTTFVRTLYKGKNYDKEHEPVVSYS